MLSKLLSSISVGDSEVPITKRSPWTPKTSSTNCKWRRVLGAKHSAPATNVGTRRSTWSASVDAFTEPARRIQPEPVARGADLRRPSTCSSVENTISIVNDTVIPKDSWCSLWLSKQGCPTPTTSNSCGADAKTTEDAVAAPCHNLRSRKRKPTAKRYQGNGATYEHGSDEELFVPPSKESRSDNSHSAHLDSYALISCADFGSFGDMKCPYHVILESSAAAMMDIHSHLCKTEVIGLLGGKFNKEDDSLRVVRAEPCWSKSTSLHCDMDPVSQTQAGEMIQQAGLQVIGWYHSHPTFIANPSQQDIESQEIFQKWFSQGGNHFLGVIISPYNSANQTASSEIRCFTTATLRGSKSIPFKFDFKVETSANNNELVDLVPKASKLLDMYKHYQHTVDLLDTYRSSSELSSLEKMLLSVASYLQTADVRHIDKNLILEDLRFVLTAYCEKAD